MPQPGSGDTVVGSARERLDRLRRSGWLVPVVLAGLLAVAVLWRPLGTNDGPAHLAFANLIAHIDEPSRTLQREAYTVDLGLPTNLFVYGLMQPALMAGAPGLAESLVQILCLLGPALAAWLAMRQIDRASAWLAVFVLPLSLHRAFFLGLYNFCLSIVGFFASVAAALWLAAAPSYGRALMLGLALSATLLMHPGGFIAAYVGVASMALTWIVLAWRSGRSPSSALREQRHLLCALLLPLALVVATMQAGAGAPMVYGPRPWSRLANMLVLRPLYLGSWTDALVAGVLSLTLIWGVSRVVRARHRRPSGPRGEHRRLMPAVLAGLISSVVVVLGFPDTAGGGWTHVQRFMVFPGFWAVLVVACLPPSPRHRRWMLAVASASFIALLASTALRERAFRSQTEDWALLDRQIGTHCTVLPVMLQADTVDREGRRIPASYTPLSHAASRFELQRDRVVLYNFLARLLVYPVQFKPQVEPQAHIFGWQPRQEAVALERLDIAGFEAASGLHVDHLLVIGDPKAAHPRLRADLQSALAAAEERHRSRDDRLRLWRRPGTSACVEADSR